MKAKKILIVSTLTLMLCACGKTNGTSSITTSSDSNSSITSSESTSSDITTSSNISSETESSSELSQVEDPSSVSVTQGQVGNLTSAMIEKIANSSITVNGTLTDYYVDGDTDTMYEDSYKMKVEMAEGAWAGSFWIEGKEDNITTDNYRKGEVVNDGKKQGSAFDRVYINKDNKATAEHETLYDGTPLFWADNHLWNHLGQLDINKFEKDVDCYTYNIDPASTTDYSQDQYLMTYLGISLTPLYQTSDGLIDTFNVYCNDTEITKIEMFTEATVLSTDSQGNPVDQSWICMTLTFSDIGTTAAPTPTPYEAGRNNDKLKAALTKMKGIKNYTFHAVDTTTSAPSSDGGDYELGANNSSIKARKHNKVQNFTNNTGTVGRLGKVTEDAILYADTGKYSYGMDDKLYHTSYSGLKQNSDNTYEEFGYSKAEKTLVGQRKYIGNMFDKMPSFDFAPEIFEYGGSNEDANGNVLYKFTLRDSTIAYQVAPEISSHTNAEDATSSVNSKFTIYVDNQGNFVKTSFPYSLVSGTYLGIVETTYSDINSTTLDADLFDGYIPRTVAQNWSDYGTMDFYETGSTNSKVTKKVTEVLDYMYGDEVANFITPKDITDVFGDGISGPWHDKNHKRDENNEYIEGEYYDEFSFNLESVNLDKNNRITDWRDLMDKMGTILGAKGYVRSAANCKDTLNSKFETFVNGSIMVVFENIGYKTIYVYCYVTGNWTLNR